MYVSKHTIHNEGAMRMTLANAATAASSISCSKLRMSGIVVDLGLEDISDDEEDTSRDLVEDNGEGGSVVQDKFEENLASSKFVAEMMKIGYREQAALIQEGLAQSSFDRGFTTAYKEALKSGKAKGEAAAKLCIAKQDQ